MKDWQKAYAEGRTPWDTGRPSIELRMVVEFGMVKPCTTLEVGCGTGTNAVYLASQGFDVTAVDIVESALAEGMTKSMVEAVPVHFVESNVLDLEERFEAESFEFVFDRGCFHAIGIDGRDRFVETIKKLTTPDAQYLLLYGNAEDPSEVGPPVLDEEEIEEAFGDTFSLEWIREVELSTTDEDQHPHALSCLMRRL